MSTTGLKMPIQVGTRGGAATIDGFEARRQNVILGVTPSSSLHPWNQELSPSDDTIFDLADEATGGLLISHIQSFFDEQERRGLTRLPKTSDSLKLDTTNVENGEVEVVINYVDLEDNQSREVRFGPGSK